MPTILRDLVKDLGFLAYELIIFIMKVIILYVLIHNLTDLHHDNALEVSLLIAGVDFLTGQRAQYRTVKDIQYKVKDKFGSKSMRYSEKDK